MFLLPLAKDRVVIVTATLWIRKTLVLISLVSWFILVIIYRFPPKFLSHQNVRTKGIVHYQGN